jgi:hypothetical protein
MPVAVFLPARLHDHPSWPQSPVSEACICVFSSLQVISWHPAFYQNFWISCPDLAACRVAIMAVALNSADTQGC